jgi:hypothetical protein
MDERVIQHYKGDLSKINMDPDERNAVNCKICQQSCPKHSGRTRRNQSY